MIQIKDSVFYIGVDDHDITLFESQYPVPQGVSYNSYFIDDEKLAVIDSVDASKAALWLDNIGKALHGRQPDYLVVHHLEPDHSGSIEAFIEKYPAAQIVLGTKAAAMLPQFLTGGQAVSMVKVNEGDTLELGHHSLKFFSAPMVHWPEVMVSFEQSTGILFSADAFGRFGALSECGFRASEYTDWASQARRYYYNIVGKYGGPVSALLTKLAALPASMILPLHGPVIDANLGEYLSLYGKWCKYEPEVDGVMIACASMHGGTMDAARKLASMLESKGRKVIVRDLCRDDMSECLSDAFMYCEAVFAACTYDGGLFTPMLNFMHRIQAKGYCNRRVGIIENGSWAPVAGRIMKEKLSEMKGLEIVEPVVTIRSRIKDLSSLEQLDENL